MNVLTCHSECPALVEEQINICFKREKQEKNTEKARIV